MNFLRLLKITFSTLLFASQATVAGNDGYGGGYDGFEEEYSDNRILRKDHSSNKRENYLIENTFEAASSNLDTEFDNGIDN